jgi:hypothetical protein
LAAKLRQELRRASDAIEKLKKREQYAEIISAFSFRNFSFRVFIVLVARPHALFSGGSGQKFFGK